jgi:hypothetical protein
MTLTARDIVMLGVGAFVALVGVFVLQPLILWLSGRSTRGEHATGDYGAVDVRAQLDKKLPEDIERHQALMDRTRTVQRRYRQARLTHPSHARRTPAHADTSSGPDTMLLSGEDAAQLLCGVVTEEIPVNTDPIFVLPLPPQQEVMPRDPVRVRNGAHSRTRVGTGAHSRFE